MTVDFEKKDKRRKWGMFSFGVSFDWIFLLIVFAIGFCFSCVSALYFFEQSSSVPTPEALENEKTFVKFVKIEDMNKAVDNFRQKQKKFEDLLKTP